MTEGDEEGEDKFLFRFDSSFLILRNSTTSFCLFWTSGWGSLEKTCNASSTYLSSSKNVIVQRSWRRTATLASVHNLHIDGVIFVSSPLPEKQHNV